MTEIAAGLTLCGMTASDILALKAEHEKAVADLREIDRICRLPLFECSLSDVAPIAAKYRETDPLVEALDMMLRRRKLGPDLEVLSDEAAFIRAELSKRGFELARVKP